MTSREWTLPAAARSVPQARHSVVDTLLEWGLPELCETAILLVSEVVTNAVLHARTDVVLKVETADVGVRVAVTDSSVVRPTSRPHSSTATTGRGLRMLDVLADSWGSDVTDSGKTVWFTVSGNRDPWSGSAAGGLG
jgi:anti-sigma regulatory factor (Ser/Thr protein kinase)